MPTNEKPDINKQGEIENIPATPPPFGEGPKIPVKKNHKPLLYTLLIIVTLSAIGFGIYAWQRPNDSAMDLPTNQTPAENSNKPQNEIPEGWAEYKDDFVSFYHPSDWTVENTQTFTDEYGAHSITLTSKSLDGVEAEDESAENLRLQATILIAPNGRFGETERGCLEACPVYFVDKISLKNPSTDIAIVISDWGSQDTAVVSIAEADTKPDAKTYISGIDAGSEHYLKVGATINSQGSNRLITPTDAKDMYDSQEYKQLKGIVESINIFLDKLPN